MGRCATDLIRSPFHQENLAISMLEVDRFLPDGPYSGLIDPSPQSFRGQPVSSWYGAGIDVQRGGGMGGDGQKQ